MVRILDCGRAGIEMNEFTKEELEEIQSSLVMTKMLDQNHDFTLTDKIQSLIDKMAFEELKAKKEADERATFRMYK